MRYRYPDRWFRICEFSSLNNTFNFGRYEGLSIADVLDLNPSYVHWCIQYCTGVKFVIWDNVIEQIKNVFPEFYMDKYFEECRLAQIDRDSFDFFEDFSDDYDNGDSTIPFVSPFFSTENPDDNTNW